MRMKIAYVFCRHIHFGHVLEVQNAIHVTVTTLQAITHPREFQMLKMLYVAFVFLSEYVIQIKSQ